MFAGGLFTRELGGELSLGGETPGGLEGLLIQRVGGTVRQRRLTRWVQD